MTIVATVAGAFALALAACSQPATDAAPADSNAAGTSEETTLETETPPADAAPEPVVVEAAACVKPVPSGAICTMDINACGKASVCDCGEGYSYNAALGMCLLSPEGVSEASIVQVEDSDCASGAAASSICTRDINVCGQPSTCSCEDGFVWNAIAGKCLKDLTAPTP